MSRHVWLLVEWLDDKNVLPNYGVADVWTNNENEIAPGKVIYIRPRRSANQARRAQVLKISDDKRLIKEHKILLQRQDNQVQNVLTLCMQTIKQMKTDPLYFSSIDNSLQSTNNPSGSNVFPQIVASVDSNSDASDSELSHDSGEVLMPEMTNPDSRRRIDNTTSQHSQSLNQSMHRRRLQNTNMPLPVVNEIRQTAIITFDQGTQTEEFEDSASLEKVERMEATVKKLYNEYKTLIARLQNINVHEQLEQNDTVSNDRPENMANECPRTQNSNGQNGVDSASVPPKTVEVRRVSAHTTNTIDNNDMETIGTGHASVPKRLLNEIDWNSYTTATRQLLQAIFPRRVLATHSLTGKQSPAFSNRPPKKCLDPLLVNDIVSTVAERCGVAKNLVRGAITIKCTDEAKLYRNRQRSRQNNSPRMNQENVSPSANSSRQYHND